MFRSVALRGNLSAGFLALGLVAGTGGTARACDYRPPCYHYEYVTTYECVTVYETREEPYTRVVTHYDHCGRPYEVTETCYHEVQVPVVHKVPVTKRVRVYD